MPGPMSLVLCSSFRQVGANGGDITVDFRARWPAEFGRYAAGITQTSSRRGRIVRAEISLNEEHFEWSTNPGVGESDVQGVVTHEVGHAIGLGHSFYRDATMYWTGGDVVLRTLSADDERGTRYLYGDPDGPDNYVTFARATMSVLAGHSALLWRPIGHSVVPRARAVVLQILRASISMEANRAAFPWVAAARTRPPAPLPTEIIAMGVINVVPENNASRPWTVPGVFGPARQGGALAHKVECVGGGGGEPGVCKDPRVTVVMARRARVISIARV